MHAKDIINLFGSQSALATLLGKRQSTISHWAKTGIIPVKSQSALLTLAAEREIELSVSDFTTANKKSLLILKVKNFKRWSGMNLGQLPIHPYQNPCS